MSDRLTDIEVKLAFLEDHLLQLDQLVREQADRIASLEADLRALQSDQPSGVARGSLVEEVPPHHGRPTDLG